MSHQVVLDTGVSQPALGSRGRSLFRAGGWLVSLLIFSSLYAVYQINGRPLNATDTIGNILLPLTIVRGEGVYLDRFAVVIIPNDQQLPYYVARFGRHLVTRYPVGSALLVLPLMAPQIFFQDVTKPGWDIHPLTAVVQCQHMARRSAGILVALTAVILYQILVQIGLARVALPAVLAAALGSDLWVEASHDLWQHGPVAFCLSLALWLLLPSPRSVPRWRLLLAGLVVTMLVWCRPIDLPLALGVVLGVTWAGQSQLRWFLPFPALGAFLLVGFNLWLFGTVLGGQEELERLHPMIHGVPSSWSGNLLSGAAGTFLSPSRGLFIYCPWAFLAIVLAPFCAKRFAPWPIVGWMLWSIVPFGLIFSKYAVWWGGHCFGPRYWIDVTPLLAILFAAALEWSWTRSRLFTAVCALAIVWSVGLQTVGAICYPSSWNISPANVDKAHERLWDWRDTELSRGLSETLRTSYH